MTKLSTIVLCFAVLFLCACGTPTNDLAIVFEDMESALKKKDESLMRKHWTIEGFNNAVIGKSGMSGSELFEEGSVEGWYPRPDFSNNKALGDSVIVQTNIWSAEKNRSLDEVYFLLEKKRDGWKIIGGGEDFSEVKNVANLISGRAVE